MTSSVKNRLLVASPALADPNFHRTVVLMLDHGEDGALGVVINRPSEVPVAESVPQWAALAAHPEVIFAGGPVAPESALCLALVRVEGEDGVWAPVLGRLGLLDMSRHPDDLGQRVEAVRIFAGCAGWAPGQLDSEIAVGAWYVVDAHSNDAVHGQPLRLWQLVLRRQGGRLAVMSAYPPDPSLN